MGHDWIIDVLSDLRSFARKNEMPLLTQQLDEAVIVASAEIATRQDRMLGWSTCDTISTNGFDNKS